MVSCAPLLSARFSCDLKLPPPQLASIRISRQRVAQTSASASPAASAALAGKDEVDIRPSRERHAALDPQQLDDAFLAERPADGRCGLAAQLRDQTVVATAGTDSVLRAQSVVTHSNTV